MIWYGEDLTRPIADSALSTVEVAERVNPSTVLIYASKATSFGYGTGFFIRQNGYIATNAHVVEGATHITVTLYSGEELEAELIDASEADDLAVLKIQGNDYPVVRVFY